MSNPGLSYDQAPPFGVPLAFFLSASLFLFLASLLGMATASDWLASRWTPAALALTHLVTLGYLGMVMVGALLQMLPVLLGMPVPWVRFVARAGVLGLATGTIMLSLGLWLAETDLIQAAMLALTLGLSPFLWAAAHSLVRARSLTWLAWPLRQAWLALAITLTLGMVLAGGLSGLWPVDDPATLTNLHLAWGLGGWILLLVIGISYQVVPMLQLTPAYPVWLSRTLTWCLFASLVAYGVVAGYAPEHELAGRLPGLAMMLAYAIATLILQRRRRRKLADATLGFWRVGMASLILCSLGLPLLPWLREGAGISVGIAFLLGFAGSVVNGMVYKIVPFLAWFHLKAQTRAPVGALPNMKEFITERAARRHLHLHVAAVLLLMMAPVVPAAAQPGWLGAAGAAMLAASALMLWRNLFSAWRLYLRHGGSL